MSEIENKSQLIQYFVEGIKKIDQLRIGVEHEKFLFEGNEKKRINYNKLKEIFEKLKKFKWEPVFEKGNIIGLKRGKQKITTEPGLQYELSGAPQKNIHLVCSENSTHFNEIQEATKGMDVTTTSVGFDPYNKVSEIPRNPKERYQIMTKEMPKGGKLSLQMMYQTSGIQINYDYMSEKDFEKKFKISNYLTPLTIALFANSPFENRKFTGNLSHRNKVWQETSRGGIMPISFESLSFEKYLDYIIQYPILFVIKDGKYIEPNGQTFKDFIEGNFLPIKGTKASIKDFELHLATIFTEVRMKQFIELRSLDTCDWGCICNGPAFFTGLLYGSSEETFDIIKNWKKDNIMQAYLDSPKLGLETDLEGRKLHEWGKIFLSLAKEGLKKRKELNSSNKDETIYLKHLDDIVIKKTNRAQLLLEKFNKHGNLDFLNHEKKDFSYTGL
ncbi:glutamate-cysteine ligase family protein [Pelagibacteraceae bacterium]|nr:glutamate-cysteine ligase family protein [Pelagibacteraceae bacterium]